MIHVYTIEALTLEEASTQLEIFLNQVVGVNGRIFFLDLIPVIAGGYIYTVIYINT